MKRVLTIQDISCLGKCSVTVALPILSAMGIETVILPTAVLSTHTMFKNFTVKDLTDQLIPITDHWKAEGVTFDAIYTGYLGSAEEISIARRIFDEFKGPDTKVIIDPVMADNGKMYPAFDEAYASLNAGLCGSADIIVPNITEACFMTGREYKEEYDEAYLTRIYVYQGQMYEWFSEETAEFEPDKGEKVCPAQELSADLSGNILTLEMRTEKGKTIRVQQVLRCGETD